MRDAQTGDVVRQFEIVHEKRLHLVMVSDDLTFFAHEHPVLGDDGRFRPELDFPGRRTLLAVRRFHALRGR